MKEIRIINLTTRKSIFEKAYLTENFQERLVGLMFRRDISDFDALVIDKCDAVHTFFMMFEIDVIFLNKDKVVIDIQRNLSPFRISRFVIDAYYVIEVPSNRNNEDYFSCGDVIDFVHRDSI